MNLVSIEEIDSDLRNQKMRDSFEGSLQKSFHIHGLSFSKKDLSRNEIEAMKKFLDGGVDYDEMMLFVHTFGEKSVITNFFNSNRYEFESQIISLRAIKEDMEKAEKNGSAITVSNDLGKEILNDPESTQLRCHSSHFNKGLGDNAGYVSATNHGYVWQLFAEGYLREITPKGVQDLVLHRYEVVISEEDASKIASDMNRDRRILEGSMCQGLIGDSPAVRSGISLITNEGKKKSLSYEATEMMASDTRKIIKKFDDSIGKIVAEVKINGNSEKVTTKFARLIGNTIESLNMNTDDFVALLGKTIKG